MAEATKRPSLAEYANDPQTVGDNGSGPGSPPAPPVSKMDVETVQTDNEMERETLLALGALVPSGALSIPPISPGHLSLFELVCPSIFGEDVITRADVSMALYVLHAGPAMLQHVYRAVLGAEACDNMVAMAYASADHFEKWLEAKKGAAREAADLRRRVIEFNHELPPYDYESVANDIARIVNESGYGFEMIPKGPTQKKTGGPLTPNGSEAPSPS